MAGRDDNGRSVGLAKARQQVELAISNPQFPLQFADVVAREVIQDLRPVEGSLTPIFRIGQDTSFEERKIFDVKGGISRMAALNEFGSFPEDTLSETQFTAKPKKYGKIFRWSREMSINENVEFINSLPERMRLSVMVTRAFEEAELLANGSGWLPAITSQASVSTLPLTVPNIETAISEMNGRTVDGNPFPVRPRFLVVPPALEIRARTILASAQDMVRSTPAAGELISNTSPMRFMPLELIVSHYLPLVIGDGAGGIQDTSWGLFNDPNGANALAVGRIGRLFGQDQPEIAARIPNHPSGFQFEDETAAWRVRDVFSLTLMRSESAWVSNGQ